MQVSATHLLGALDAEPDMAVGVTHDNKSLRCRQGVNTSLATTVQPPAVAACITTLWPCLIELHTLSSFCVGSHMGCWAHAQSGGNSKLVSLSYCRRAHLEARALAGAGLLLNGHDLHDLVLQDGAQEELHDLVLLDGHREQENVLQLFDLALQCATMSLSA